MRALRMLLLISALAPAFGETLFDEPAGGKAEPPAPPEPGKETPSEPAKPAPAPETPVGIPAAGKRSRPSAPLQARTVAGVRIVEAKESSLREAWFEVERWVSRGNWVKSTFLVKKGSAVGEPKKVGGKLVDFSTPWNLLAIKKEEKAYPGAPIDRMKLDANNQPIKDRDGNFVRETVPGPEVIKTVHVATLQHVRAKGPDGALLQVSVVLAAGEKVSLPEISEDETPVGAP